MSSTSSDWVMACMECGEVFGENVALSVAKEHMVTSHHISDAHIEPIWMGNGTPPEGWMRCNITEGCYRPAAHVGDCADRSKIRQ